MNGLSGIPVFRDPNCSPSYDDGRPRLFTLVTATNPPCVLVHPSRWDAFVMAINHPDIFGHPEVKAILGIG